MFMVKQCMKRNVGNYEARRCNILEDFSLQLHCCETVKSHIISVKVHVSIKQLITSMLTTLHVTQSVITIIALNMYSATMTLGVLTLAMEKTA
jgi:hypothetical protein